jgi:hypothetical protein
VGTDELQAPGDSIIKKLKASAKATPAAAAGKKPPLPDVSEIDLPSHHVFINPKEVRAEITALKTRYKCTNADLANAVWPEKQPPRVSQVPSSGVSDSNQVTSEARSLISTNPARCFWSVCGFTKTARRRKSAKRLNSSRRKRDARRFSG